MKKNNNLAYIWWLTITASLGGLLFGYDTAVISGTLSMVRTQFGLNAAMEGWYVSSALVGCVIGVSFAGWLSDKYGRKKVLLLAATLFTISALGCALIDSFSALVLYRLVGGMGVGMASMLPRFLRRYHNLQMEIKGAVQNYIEDVRSQNFPNEKEQY